MRQYKVHFARYLNGENRLSAPQWVSAEDLTDAVKTAGHMLIALRGADPEASFEIASVEIHGLIAKQCDGARMFETAEELSQRVNPKKSA